MEWDKKKVDLVYSGFLWRYASMKREARTDRRNFSAIWNKYLDGYGVTLLVPPGDPKNNGNPHLLLRMLIGVINEQNERVSDAILIGNPDRQNQYLLVPRDVAQKILVLGMI